MSPTHRRTPRGVGTIAAVIVLVAGACGSPPTVTRTPIRPTTSAAFPSAPASTGPFTPMVYPVAAEAPCDEAAPPDATHAAYTGEFKRIRAKDAHTVIFDLCAPDIAFGAKLATPSLAIQDTAWLQSRIDPSAGTPRILREVNGTGPYRLDAWTAGSDITLLRNDAYWGSPATPDALVFRWSDDPAHRLDALNTSTVDGIEPIAPSDVQSVTDNADLRLVPRPGWNVAYVGFNNRFAPFDNVSVRQAIAMSLDRAKIVSTLFPAGSEVADHFAPCSIPYGCVGPAWYGMDAVAGKDLLTQAGFKKGFHTTIHYPMEPRDYLPDPQGVATEIQTELKATLGIDSDLDPQPFDQLLATADSGKLGGIYLLGARTTYPDVTTFLDTHFGSSASAQFGGRWSDLAAALDRASSFADPVKRQKSYVTANDAIRRHVPMVPLAHVGSLTAYRADVLGVLASAPGTERFANVTPGDRGQFAWMGQTEPGSLYCADETDVSALRICAQVSESLMAYNAAAGSVEPSLASACTPVADLTSWTCTLRENVRFHDGAALDANDVVLSFAVQWDAEHPLHRGRSGTFTAFTDRFGGFLHPSATVPPG